MTFFELGHYCTKGATYIRTKGPSYAGQCVCYIGHNVRGRCARAGVGYGLLAPLNSTRLHNVLYGMAIHTVAVC